MSFWKTKFDWLKPKKAFWD